ncbi:serine hydrolase [Streptomyces sp. NPDC005494]|uniref:serine hydrolase n=1 Tax=Streptomyces sp. NPDC005494 TaxID=3364715 RepID=UPI00369E6540
MTPRRIKEASVAGESPGKSEQRKSSGTTEERDPRLAVFREPGAEADGSAAEAGTDSATAVFRLPRSSEEAASEGSSGSLEGAEAAEGAEDGSRTRGGAGEAAEVEEGETTDVAATATGPAGSRDSASGDAKGAQDAKGPEDAEEADTSEGSEDAENSGASESSEEDAENSGASESPEDAEPSDARLRAVVAAWVAGDDEEESGRAGTTADEGKPAEDDVTGPATDASVPAEADASAEDKAAAAEVKTAEVEDKVPAPAEVKTAEVEDKVPAPAEVKSAEVEDKVPSTPEDKTAQVEDKVPAPAEDDDAAVAVEDAVPVTDEDAEDAAPAEDNTPADKAPADAPRIPKTREEPSAAGSAPEAADEDADEPADEDDKAEASAVAAAKGEQRGIDHPTTAFKAPRAPQVDQPTTALKLPPREETRKPASWGAKPSGTSGTSGTPETPEAPAERTSKFVPLRSDDVRPAPPVIGPTVTPDVSIAAGAPGAPGAGLTEAERTRQQPMPPKPPLDLLAELTNTPPPPETPVRTAVRRVKIWTPLLLLLVIVFAIAQAVRPLPEPALTLTASPTYTFGGEKLDMPWPAEGQGAVEVEGVGTLGSYGADKPAPIASMAKVMTAYVILQGHPITGEQTGDQITVDKQAAEEAANTDESMAGIKEGDKYTERQMLQMLMIPSGNNVARLLARWDATTEKAFVEKMNAAAEDLGMTDSTYTDPSGLKSSTVSTPADQIALGKAVMQNDIFREIVNMPQADIPGVGKIYNNNTILLEDGVNGIKTGSSTPAGGNLLWTADTVVDGKTRRIIGAVMGADTDGTLYAKLERAIQNSLTLIRAAQKGVDSATVVKKGQVVGYVDNGFGTQTPVVATKDLKAVGWGGLKVELDLGAGDEPLQQTAKAGTVVGEVTIGTGTGKVSAPVALQSEMTEPGFGDKFTRIT